MILIALIYISIQKLGVPRSKEPSWVGTQDGSVPIFQSQVYTQTRPLHS